MLSYTSLRNLFGKYTNNTTSSNLTDGDQYINDAIRQICASNSWDFIEKTSTATTTASTQSYKLPFDYDKLISVTVTIGTTQYIAREVADKITWDYLNQNTQITSNIPSYYFILGEQLLFWPIPSSSSNTITYTYLKRVKDLSNADLTAQTVSVTSGSTTVTGSGTSWRRGIIGSWIKIAPNTSSDTTSGDGEWYEISAVASTTSLTLVKAYNGSTVTSGTAIIGQMPVLPDSYHKMPVYRAAVEYWIANDNDKKAKYYQDLFDSMMTQLEADHLSKTTDDTLNDIEDAASKNPNLYILS